MNKEKKIIIFVAIGVIVGMFTYNMLSLSVERVIRNGYLYKDCIENKKAVDSGVCAKTFKDCSCSYFGEKSCGSVITENNFGRDRDVLVLTCLEFSVVDKQSSNIVSGGKFFSPQP